jgi:hypothetical protein
MGERNNSLSVTKQFISQRFQKLDFVTANDSVRYNSQHVFSNVLLTLSAVNF